MAKCSFLNVDEIELIYKIYDNVNDYDYWYKIKKKEHNRKEDIKSYNILRDILFDRSKGYCDIEKYSKRYDDLLKSLQKKIPGRKTE